MKNYFTDKLATLIGNFGDPSRDKAASVSIVDEEFTDEQLAAAFNSNWIARKVITIPAQDATRKWRDWSGEGADAVEVEEKRLNLRAKTFEAAWKARLWGGAAIYIGIEGQDPVEPLDVESVGADQLQYLNVMTRRELIAGDLERDPLSPYYGTPQMYTIEGDSTNALVHPSRLALFYGSTKADTWQLSANRNDGWGDSVLKSVYDTIRHSGGVFAGVASLVMEANVDVIAVQGLMSRVNDETFRNQVLKRFSLAAANKGVNGTLIIDKDGEEYHRKSASFNNLSVIMQMYAMLCSAAADIPATRFLAQSPTGLNSSGESDMANYHDMLESIQSLTIAPAIELLDKCMIRSALGQESEEIQARWMPLKQTSELDEAEIAKARMDAMSKMDLSVMPEETMYEVIKSWGWFAGVDISNFEDFSNVMEAQRGRLEQV